LKVTEVAAELAALRPDAIVAVNTPDVAAALLVTKTIPIAFVNPADPIGSEFIASLARPGGNATGTTNLTIDIVPKRLEVLQEIAPSRTQIGFISMQKGISASLDHVNQKSQRRSSDGESPWADDGLASTFQLARSGRGRGRPGTLRCIRSAHHSSPKADR
jgi:hypothetical protein